MVPFRLLSLAALVSFCGLSTASSAQAAEKAAFVVENPTAEVIKYQVVAGATTSGRATPSTPASSRHHSHTLDEDGFSPIPYLRFDCIADDDEVTYRTYRMETYGVFNPWNGKAYVFRYSGRFLDLYK